MKAPIVEVFETIQGEGINIGKPCIFVRFWGCTLRCRFDGEQCDTPYAVFKDRDKTTQMTCEELSNEILKLRARHIIFTGGEPTLFQDFIGKVIEIVDKKRVSTFEVETNGTNKLYADFANMIDYFNVSVKLKSSNQMNEDYDKKRFNQDALDTFPFGKSVFKFVVTNKEDLAEIDIIIERYQWPVYLMPKGATRKELIKNSPEVVDLCIERGWRFSPRAHVMIWDNKKGV